MFHRWKKKNTPYRGKVQRQIQLKVYSCTHTHTEKCKYIVHAYGCTVFRCLDTSERSHLNYLIKKMMWLTFPNSPKDGTQLILYKEETLVHSNSILRALALNSLSELKRQYREVWFNLD